MKEDNKQRLKTGEKLMFIVAGAFVILASIAFAVMQYLMFTRDEPLFEQKTHYDLSAEGQKGSLIFREAACTECHRAMRGGTNMGNNLDGTGSKRTLQWIEDFLADPEPVYGHETMDHGPKPKQAFYVAEMSEQERHLMAVYLSQLISEQGSASSPVPPKGESPFIDAMVNTWAPDAWKEKYKDIRDKDSEATGER
ncbi:MAG: c-type cytochrome [Mariprofundaceae bacterium]|nr:c-type cytochrome [Mariprofundaceae bacterium]